MSRTKSSLNDRAYARRYAEGEILGWAAENLTDGAAGLSRETLAEVTSDAMRDWDERMAAGAVNKRKEIDYAIGAAISRRFLSQPVIPSGALVPVHPAGRNSDRRVAEAIEAAARR